ncbi:hypothetical protein H6F67_16445 [Microcoleus sp. FACHB-1515]|uniref:hypothetical protein n=1 Tax=Cyanophyceae TaxID=3028117 RepID=UPI001682DA30|nr:hypothetical protein [Microcoleus sp. FACHB-1515]MBD2091434.1 hypothetical protein [Microcoleus sp. FACHB-1515]
MFESPMKTGDRSTSMNLTINWFSSDSEALPCISPQDLQAMDALFKNLDPESVEHDLLLQKPPAIDPLEWDLVDLIA